VKKRTKENIIVSLFIIGICLVPYGMDVFINDMNVGFGFTLFIILVGMMLFLLQLTTQVDERREKNER